MLEPSIDMNDRMEIQMGKYFQRPFFKPGVGKLQDLETEVH